MSIKVAALYVQKNGCYYGLQDVDPWDEERDARLYVGSDPVVAHPPCARWCRLAGLVEKRSGHKIGDDGGTFDHALRTVRRTGGVLEHPSFTIAWSRYGLQAPNAFGWTREMFGPGWVCEVSQAAYGHRAQKLTWLYYVGNFPPPPLDWSRPIGSARISSFYNSRQVEIMGKVERNKTPIVFRDLLLSLARLSRSGAPAAPVPGVPGAEQLPLTSPHPPALTREGSDPPGTAGTAPSATEPTVRNP